MYVHKIYWTAIKFRTITTAYAGDRKIIKPTKARHQHVLWPVFLNNYTTEAKLKSTLSSMMETTHKSLNITINNGTF
jgi:hypothetical protein